MIELIFKDIAFGGKTGGVKSKKYIDKIRIKRSNQFGASMRIDAEKCISSRCRTFESNLSKCGRME